jgi:hypothetical protein
LSRQSTSHKLFKKNRQPILASLNNGFETLMAAETPFNGGAAIGKYGSKWIQ